MLTDVTSNAQSKKERRKEGTDSTGNIKEDQHSITFNLLFLPSNKLEFSAALRNNPMVKGHLGLDAAALVEVCAVSPSSPQDPAQLSREVMSPITQTALSTRGVTA